MALTPSLPGASRTLNPAAYAVGGRAPRLALRPTTRDEACEALREAARDGHAVIPWGGGMGLAHEPAPERYDVALDLTALDRIVEYEPEDLTLTAECGVTIETLRATLAARGQELPLEAPLAARATLGGVLAANASGPRRLRFGAPRDRILGARFALGDGTLARSGGKVVKNVAGYGIHRLLCGSRGGLAVILEASLKLMPAPERRAALAFAVTGDALADAARWSPFPRLEPALLSVVGRDLAAALPLSAPREPFVAIVGVEEEEAWAERQIEAATRALGVPIARAEGGDAQALWQALADLEEQRPTRLSFTTARNTPAAIAGVLADDVGASAVFHALAGRLHLFPEPGQALEIIAALGECGFTLIGARATGEIEPAIPPQAAVGALRRNIRESLDPGRRFALGEFWERGGA